LHEPVGNVDVTTFEAARVCDFSTNPPVLAHKRCAALTVPGLYV